MAEKTTPVRRYKRFTERRMEILRSAAAAFSKSGFSGATMEEIAEKVHMTKGNLYYYFPSKEDLLFFCQEQSLGMLIEQADEVSGSGRPADEQLRTMIAYHVRILHEKLPGSTAHTDFRSLPPPLLKKILKKRDRYENAYRAVIDRGIREGLFQPCDARTATWSILGALNWSVQWFRPSGPISVDQLGNDFAELFSRALKKS